MKDTDPGARSIKCRLNACWVIVLDASEKQMKCDVCFVPRKTFLVIFRQDFQRPSPFFSHTEESPLGQGKPKKALQDWDLLQSKQLSGGEGPLTIPYEKDSTALNKSQKIR